MYADVSLHLDTIRRSLWLLLGGMIYSMVFVELSDMIDR
jgi:hypothetical protein